MSFSKVFVKQYFLMYLIKSCDTHHRVHYGDVTMGPMASQITSFTIVSSTVYSGADQRKHWSSASLAFVVGNSPMTGDFPAQKASNAENTSSWWRLMAVFRVTIIPCGWAWNLELENMMTSSNGNIFRVTGHLRGDFTGPRWIPHTKASDAKFWCFLWSASE